MIKFTDIWLNNVVLYQKQHISITDNNGLVIVTGKNKDSRISKEQNNGAGKSLLFSSIPNLLYGSSPMSTSKNAKKEMLDNQSCIKIAFENKDRVRISQTPKNWIIEKYENNKYVDQQARTVAIQQQQIKQLFPISETEFYSYIYLQSQRRLDFQIGKPLDRLNFITEVFQLHEYDRLKKYFTQMLGTIRDKQTKYDVIMSKLLSLKESIKKLKWTDKKKEQLDNCKIRLEEVKEKHIDLGREIANYRSLYKGISSLKKLDKQKEDCDASHAKEISKFENCELAIAYYKKQIELYHKQENYRISYIYAKKQKRKILAKQKELNVHDIKTLIKQKQVFQKKLENLLINKKSIEVEERKWQAFKEEEKEALKKLTNLGYSYVEDIDTTTDVDKKLSNYQQIYRMKKLVKNHNSTCPTCKQHVDISFVQKRVNIAKEKIQYYTDLKEARQLKTILSEKPVRPNTDIEAIQDKINKYKRSLEEVEKNILAYNKHKELEQDYNEIELPKEPKEKSDFNDINIPKSLLDSCNLLDKIEHSIANVYDTHKGIGKLVNKFGLEGAEKLVSDWLEVNSSHYDDLSEEQSELLKYVSRMELKYGQYKVLSSQILEYEKEAEELRPFLDKQKMYKALEQAYGSKGLKVERADEIVAILETHLNSYSSLLFAEPFTFSVYANEKGIVCNVKRGKKESDVRLLSGAESDCFRLLFLCSMLSIVPSSRRTNFVVLDEPDSHMDNSTRELFRDNFLPYLRQIVPHIFCITPKDPHFYSDFEHWQIVKENGISQVKVV